MKKLTAKEIRRKDKYPDTETFHWHNENPKGHLVCDCAIRAIATATESSWQETFKAMSDFAFKDCSMIDDKSNIEKYLKKIGWQKNKQPRKSDNTKYTGSDFCRYLDRIGNTKNIIANIGGHHMVCIKYENGTHKVNDTWDSTYKCIGNYWTI